MPEELKMQLPIIREVLSSMEVNIVEMAGYEADDLLGTLAKKAEKEGLEVTLLSGDRDLLQIASEHIKISIPKTTGGKTETFNYFEKDVVSEYGVTPLEFIEVKALQGDSSDNIPGVSKVGPKTATELIATYHSLENLYEHIDEITKKALHENLVNDKEMAFFSRTLSRIETAAPIVLNLDASRFTNLLNENSMEVLLKYSLKSVINKLENIGGSDATAVKENRLEDFTYETVEDFNKTEEILKKIAKAKSIGMAACDTGVAVSFGDYTFHVKTEVLEETGVYSVCKIGAYDVIMFRSDSENSVFGENYSMSFGTKTVTETVKRKTVEKVVTDYDTITFTPVKITSTDCFAAEGKSYTFAKESQ